MTELADFVGVALRMVQTEEQLTAGLEKQETLTKEMISSASSIPTGEADLQFSPVGNSIGALPAIRQRDQGTLSPSGG